MSVYYRQLLEINHIVALGENVWKQQPPEADFYRLLGIPSELVTVNPTEVNIATTFYVVEPVDTKPNGFSDVDAPLFYGHVKLGEGFTSIRGMSGGPIFAFRLNEKGELRYWLTALQSRWLPETHFIAACPTKLLGEFLEHKLDHRLTPI